MIKRMKNLKFISLMLLSALLVPMVSCNGETTSGSSEATLSSSNGEVFLDQVVNVKVFDTYLVSDIEVELYNSNNEIVSSGYTDEHGVAIIPVSSYGEYTIKIGDESAGFYADADYKTSADGSEVSINCKTRLIDSEMPNGTTYEIGSIMYDFEFKTSENVVKKASDYLVDHEAILLNLWYEDCYYCNLEFPLVETAYQSYGDRVAFVALSPYDTNSSIASYKSKMGLTFDMGADIPGLSNVFMNSGMLTGFPTSFIIDKYGIITDFHEGAINSMLDVDVLFSDVLSPDYVPAKVQGSTAVGSDGNGIVKPNVTMPDSSVIEDAINGEGYTFSYYAETDPNDAEYTWPWVVADDGVSIKPSNYTIDSSFATIYSDFSLSKDKAIAFDYRSSTEAECDIVYVLIDGVIQAVISGESDGWQTCYPYVGLSSGKHTLAIVYLKDESSSVGEDAVYIKNLRVIDSSEIDQPVYILRECFKGQSSISGAYLFVNPVYNEEDGYYHVDSANGPLIMANLLNSTLWSQYTLLDYARNGYLSNIEGKDYTDLIIEYAGYTTNGGMDLVPVTQELKDALTAIGKANPLIYNEEKEWLLMCNYYSAYGTDGKELEDPIAGLAPFSAFDANLGENVITFESTLVPRGKYSKFVPETSGVYKITTEEVYTSNEEVNSTLDHRTTCWLFDENLNLLAQGERNGRVHFETEDHNNFILYYYLEEGETYYVNCAFEDIYRYTDLKFIISYVDESYDYLRACTPPTFTTDEVDINGMPSGNIIHGGIEAAMGEDNYYHHLKENGELGSIIYCEFIYVTETFNFSILDMIPMGAFNFTLDEYGESSSGVDLTDEISAYEDKMIKDPNSELFGLVPVDERLAEILQLLLDKYTFKDVYQSWLKVCYYYEHHGA